MPKDIHIKKGLHINLVGESEKTTSNIPISSIYGLRLESFHGITPKLIVRQGSNIKAGEALFYSKNDERILFPSPVSGKVVEIVRGERRKVLEIKIKSDSKQVYKNFGKQEVSKMTGEEVKNHLFTSCCWPFIKQRPYDLIANPNSKPKSIFISGHISTPLSPDLDYILAGKELELQVAISAISKLTEGKVHVSVEANSKSPLAKLSNVEVHKVSGPHPSGNVGTQIAKIDPINKGEVVWTITPQDLVVIGELLLTGKFNIERTIALLGSCFKKPKYVKAISGASIKDIVASNLNNDNTRIINGNVLTGSKVSEDGFLDYYNNQITAIPEGNDYDFFGWNKPIFNKISISRALTFSWLNPNKKYKLNTNTNGERRAFVVTGAYEEVFPLDIYPMQLLKAFLVKDLDGMEALGGYEVAPEDFALTEFVCVSKQPHQKIIREGLDLMKEELG